MILGKALHHRLQQLSICIFAAVLWCAWPAEARTPRSCIQMFSGFTPAQYKDFENRVVAFRPNLMRWARAQKQMREIEPEDVVQEIITRALENPEPIMNAEKLDPSEFTQKLFAIGINISRKDHKRASRILSQPLVNGSIMITSDEGTEKELKTLTVQPADQESNLVALETIEKLESLSSIDQNILALFFDGQSYPSIAAELQMPLDILIQRVQEILRQADLGDESPADWSKGTKLSEEVKDVSQDEWHRASPFMKAQLLKGWYSELQKKNVPRHRSALEKCNDDFAQQAGLSFSNATVRFLPGRADRLWREDGGFNYLRAVFGESIESSRLKIERDHLTEMYGALKGAGVIVSATSLYELTHAQVTQLNLSYSLSEIKSIIHRANKAWSDSGGFHYLASLFGDCPAAAASPLAVACLTREFDDLSTEEQKQLVLRQYGELKARNLPRDQKSLQLHTKESLAGTSLTVRDAQLMFGRAVGLWPDKGRVEAGGFYYVVKFHGDPVPAFRSGVATGQLNPSTDASGKTRWQVLYDGARAGLLQNWYLELKTKGLLRHSYALQQYTDEYARAVGLSFSAADVRLLEKRANALWMRDGSRRGQIRNGGAERLNGGFEYLVSLVGENLLDIRSAAPNKDPFDYLPVAERRSLLVKQYDQIKSKKLSFEKTYSEDELSKLGIEFTSRDIQMLRSRADQAWANAGGFDYLVSLFGDAQRSEPESADDFDKLSIEEQKQLLIRQYGELHSHNIPRTREALSLMKPEQLAGTSLTLRDVRLIYGRAVRLWKGRKNSPLPLKERAGFYYLVEHFGDPLPNKVQAARDRAARERAPNTSPAE